MAADIPASLIPVTPPPATPAPDDERKEPDHPLRLTFPIVGTEQIFGRDTFQHRDPSDVETTRLTFRRWYVGMEVGLTSAFRPKLEGPLQFLAHTRLALYAGGDEVSLAHDHSQMKLWKNKNPDGTEEWQRGDLTIDASSPYAAFGGGRATIDIIGSDGIYYSRWFSLASYLRLEHTFNPARIKVSSFDFQTNSDPETGSRFRVTSDGEPSSESIVIGAEEVQQQVFARDPTVELFLGELGFMFDLHATSWLQPHLSLAVSHPRTSVDVRLTKFAERTFRQQVADEQEGAPQSAEAQLNKALQFNKWAPRYAVGLKLGGDRNVASATSSSRGFWTKTLDLARSVWVTGEGGFVPIEVGGNSFWIPNYFGDEVRTLIWDINFAAGINLS